MNTASPAMMRLARRAETLGAKRAAPFEGRVALPDGGLASLDGGGGGGVLASGEVIVLGSPGRLI
ncbi:hypothetical protein [Adlercreutzia sp. ZJ242]|uniref:hypothetical protein n=1 Tax=Adlercreutzia sp. ZJ242 TaxID=2709409 RepID=UPI001F149ABA|nr:hypothetical protein [Adlercreutzia sp. ZJ242]